MKAILGKKVGMTQVFNETGEAVPVTVIEAGPCYVTQVKTLENDDDWISTVTFSSDSRLLAASGYDRAIRIWRLRNSLDVPTMTLNGHSLYVRSLLFSEDNRTLFSASADRTIKIWDLPTGQERFTLAGHDSAVDCICLSSDESILISGSRDETVRVWRAATQEEVNDALHQELTKMVADI